MGRPHIEFIHSRDVEPVDAPAPFGGARERRLSTDDETGAYTSLLEIPSGWRAELGVSARPIELFGLRGELRVGGDRFGPGCYVYLESGLRAAELAADEDALLLAMPNDEAEPGPTGAWEVVDTEEMPYSPGGFSETLEPGIVVKRVRVDAGTGNMSWVAAAAPNKRTPFAEIHSAVEEAFMIRGDCLMGEHGEMGPGDYFWRPGMVRHGPMGTRTGTFFFLRTHGGGIDLATEETPGWQEKVREYRARRPYFHG